MTVTDTDPPPLTPRGHNQSVLRDRNERLVLSLLRREPGLPKAEIARQTGLSAQTVSVIMRALEQDGMIRRGAPQRGRVGQPSVPMSLNPDGAFFLGLRIGRRSLELVLVDFLGAIRGRRLHHHRWPTPEVALAFADDAARALIATLPQAQRPRVAGMGIAMPFRPWDWAEGLGAAPGAMEGWRNADLCSALAARHPFPVFEENDATAACRAELVFGTAPMPADALHATIGFLVGGGVILGGAIHGGADGNAGALASLPVRDARGQPASLLSLASLAALEQMLVARGEDATALWQTPDTWSLPAGPVDTWIETAAAGLAQAAIMATALIETRALIIDGWLPETIRARLVTATQRALAADEMTGLHRPQVIAGSIGPGARALGAAALALSDRFLLDQRAAS